MQIYHTLLVNIPGPEPGPLFSNIQHYEVLDLSRLFHSLLKMNILPCLIFHQYAGQSLQRPVHFFD